MLGIVVLLLGVNFRLVDAFVLNESASKVFNERLAPKSQPVAQETYAVSLDPVDDWWEQGSSPAPSAPRRTVRPPNWLGWSLISVGAVMILTCPCFRR